MKMLVRGSDLGRRLCELFGIDPAEVSSIAITAKAGDVSTVTIERFIKTEEADKLSGLLSEYALAAKPAPSTPADWPEDQCAAGALSVVEMSRIG